MNWWRVLVWSFWIFVISMLIWQAYDYNSKLALTPAQPEKHYFYNPGIAQPPPRAPGADVRQVTYRLMGGTPSPGSFTIKFSVKNIGSVTATAVQVNVKPYRGIPAADSSNPLRGAPRAPSELSSINEISDSSPTSQIGQWVGLPDIAPGQAVTNSVVFTDQAGLTPNDNPKLEITFVPAKSN